MRVRDFGHFEGPLVLFGGPYSNLQALEAMAEVIGEEAAVCTGDVVGYCGNPAESVALMRDMAVPVIAGNCERQVAEGAEDCGCGFEDGSVCDIASRGWFPFAKAAFDAEAMAWLDDLPEVGVFQLDGRRYGVVHGGATEIARFIWPTSPEAVFRDEIEALERLAGPVDGVVSGHSGIAFHRRIGRHHWINGGVIGMPPHDGRPETRYAVLTAGDVLIERLSYDHEAAAQAMVKAGLTQGYQEALLTGIWPSEDVLPVELRR